MALLKDGQSVKMEVDTGQPTAWDSDVISNPDHVLKLAVEAFCFAPSYQDGVSLIQLADHLLPKRLVSVQRIEGAVDSLLELLAESNLAGGSQYTVEHTVCLISKLATHLPDAVPLWERLWMSLEKTLTHSPLASARAHCLQTMARLAVESQKWTPEGASVPSSDKPTIVQNLLAKYLSDCDHRVRIASLDCLLLLSDSGVRLLFDHYKCAVKLINDEDQVVRLRAIHLLPLYSQQFADRHVESDCNRVQLRLGDHAFGKMCYVMQDSAVSNRVAAARLLGTMEGVSDKFLEQTLDKKLLKSMKVFRDVKEAGGGQEWASGRMFGADAPADLLDGSYIPLIDSQACGAFVAGLEDEHMDVRNASINSVSALAAKNKEFCQKCLDFLVDMFNDEIDEVRLNAINHLAKLCPYATISDEQLESIYNGLVDSSSDGREAIRQVLACCRLESSVGLKNALDALLRNLMRNPEDKLSVWQCAKELGSKLPGLVLPLLTDMLSSHPYIESVEQKLEDTRYVTKLMVVFNAAKYCPTIAALFTKCLWRHYEYLRANFPQLIPRLREARPFHPPFVHIYSGSCDYAAKLEAALASVDNVDEDALAKRQLLDPFANFASCHDGQDGGGLVKSIQIALTEASRLPLDKFVPKFYMISRDLESLCKSGGEEYGITECSVNCAQMLSLIYEALMLLEKCGMLIEPNVVTKLKEALTLTFKVQSVWNNNEEAVQFSSEVQFWAVLLLVYFKELRIEMGGSVNAICSIADTNDLIQLAFQLDKRSVLPSIVERRKAGIKWVVTGKRLIDAFKTMLVRPVIIRDRTVQRKAVILEPQASSKRVLRFVGGLALSMHFELQLFGFDMEDAHSVYLRIVYPDNRVALFVPKGEFADFSPEYIRIRMDIVLSERCWTSPAPIETCVVLVASSRANCINRNIRTTPISDTVPVVIFPRKMN